MPIEPYPIKSIPCKMKNHITCLDGIRGLLAMWVFWGHICIFVGLKMPILGTPALAVDLFMLLSGFLMAYQLRSSGFVAFFV